MRRQRKPAIGGRGASPSAVHNCRRELASDVIGFPAPFTGLGSGLRRSQLFFGRCGKCCGRTGPRTLKAFPSKAQGWRLKGANPGHKPPTCRGTLKEFATTLSPGAQSERMRRPGEFFQNSLPPLSSYPGLPPVGRQPWALLGNAFSVRVGSASRPFGDDFPLLSWETPFAFAVRCVRPKNWPHHYSAAGASEIVGCGCGCVCSCVCGEERSVGRRR